MSYTKIAESSDFGISVEIHEKDLIGSFSYELILKDVIEKQGQVTNEKYTAHLPFELEVPVVDFENELISHFRNRNLTDFKVYLYDESSNLKFHGYLNTRFPDHNFGRSTNVLKLSAYDGITTLKGKSIEFNQHDRLPVGDILKELINNTGIAEDVVIATDLQHTGQSSPGGILPNGYRVDPWAFLRQSQDSDQYTLLISMLEFYGWQLFQDSGRWMVMDRDSRDNATLTEYNITADTSSSPSKSKTLVATDFIEDPKESNIYEIGQFTREITLGKSQYEFLNSEFENWEVVNNSFERLLDWQVNNQDYIRPNVATKTLDDPFPTKVEFLNPAAELRQQPIVPLAVGSFKLKFNVEFNLNPGYTSGFPLTVTFGRIRAYNTNTDNWYSLDPATGQWNYNGFDNIKFDLNSDTYDLSQNFSLDKDVDNLPYYSVIVVLINFSDPSGIVDGLPTFRSAGLIADNVTAGPSSKEILYNNNQSRENKNTFTVLDRTSLMSRYSDHEYFDGSSWENGKEWNDGNRINEYISKRIIESSLTSDQTLDINTFRDDIKLYSLLHSSVAGLNKDYLPIFRQKSHKQSYTRIYCTEIKKGTAGPLTINVKR